MCSTLFLRAHEHIYFMECALSQNVLLPLLMVHFVTRMYYYYYTITISLQKRPLMQTIIAFVLPAIRSIGIYGSLSAKLTNYIYLNRITSCVISRVIRCKWYGLHHTA